MRARKSFDAEKETPKQEEKIVKCPDCGSKEITYEKGERFCKKCGLVIEY